MFSNRIFQAALLISFIIHGVILAQNPDFSLNIFQKSKEGKELEISYIRQIKEQRPAPKAVVLKRDLPMHLPPKITVDKTSLPPSLSKENIIKANLPAASRDKTFAKPSLVKADVLSIKRKITLPPLDTTKINNPSYISYYQLVREKIKRAAYQNYTGTEQGETTISFVISNDGYLRDLRLIEEKSSASSYLREIAVKSVRDAADFPAFPEELDYPQLSFNLAITFEIE